MAWGGVKSWVSSDTIAAPETELNRIEGNIKAIYDLLTPYTIVAAQTHKVDWAQTDYPTTAQAKNIDDNIKAFYDLYCLTFTGQDWTGIVFADWRQLNYWETKIQTMYTQALALEATIRLCGSFNCGE